VAFAARGLRAIEGRVSRVEDAAERRWLRGRSAGLLARAALIAALATALARWVPL